MTQETAKLLVEALRLPESERSDLATHLIESIDPTADNDVEAAWSQEIQKRIEELREGKVKPLSWPEARRIIMKDDDESSPA